MSKKRSLMLVVVATLALGFGGCASVGTGPGAVTGTVVGAVAANALTGAAAPVRSRMAGTPCGPSSAGSSATRSATPSTRSRNDARCVEGSGIFPRPFSFHDNEDSSIVST